MKEAIELYLKFRQELDALCVPLILKSEETYPIKCDGKTVGILCTDNQYIDCIYILPEYRKRGLARREVLKWYEAHKDNALRRPRLHIINNNEPAKKFWSILFELDTIAISRIDTLYEIQGLKE